MPNSARSAPADADRLGGALAGAEQTQHARPVGLAERELADAIAETVLDHPRVVRLDGGAVGTVASYLPGRRVVGVRAGEPGDGVEIAVVARLGTPLPELVDEIRQRVRQVTGPVPVDVVVCDLAVGDAAP